MDTVKVKINDKIKKQNSKRNKTGVWYRFKKNKTAMFGLAAFVLIILIAVSADFIYDYQTEAIDQNISQRLIRPSKDHFLGTDDFGRSLVARIFHGARRSLFISLLAVSGSAIVGLSLGSIAGYYGGKIDNLIMRITDIFMAIPMTMLAIVIVAALGPSTKNLILALFLSQIPDFTRITRGSVLMVRSLEYIEAARAIGCKDSWIILSHVIPNSLSPVIVQFAIRSAMTITNTAALSFLGLGVQPPTPEWGGLIASGRTYIRDYSYLTSIPGLIMMLTILSLNLIGDGLRDALDPRLKV